MANTKKFTFGIAWQMYGASSIEVPADFTIEQAMEHVQANWQNIGLPRGEYVPESDAPDFDHCGFEEDGA